MTPEQPPPPEFVQAAEWTIAAAAAAVFWCGDDPHGVLVHGAAADPVTMACTRALYAQALSVKTLLPIASETLLRFLGSSAIGVEVAALPESIAPQWAVSVRNALWAAREEIDASITDDPRGVVIYQPSDPVQHARVTARYHSLSACLLWGNDALWEQELFPLYLFRTLTQAVFDIAPAPRMAF
jgi:hypothetical protein